MERLAELITIKINSRLNKQGLEYKKMKLGVEVLVINLSKAAVILFAAAQLGTLKETLLMLMIFGALRKSSFGLHSNNSIICTLTCLVVFIFGASVSYYIRLSKLLVAVIFMVLNLLILKYAPADTAKHPLLGKKLRKRLRKKSVTAGVLFMITALAISEPAIQIMIIIAVSAQVVSILPITYKILNRRYKNYELYEGTIN